MEIESHWRYAIQAHGVLPRALMRELKAVYIILLFLHITGCAAATETLDPFNPFSIVYSPTATFYFSAFGANDASNPCTNVSDPCAFSDLQLGRCLRAAGNNPIRMVLLSSQGAFGIASPMVPLPDLSLLIGTLDNGVSPVLNGSLSSGPFIALNRGRRIALSFLDFQQFDSIVAMRSDNTSAYFLNVNVQQTAGSVILVQHAAATVFVQDSSFTSNGWRSSAQFGGVLSLNCGSQPCSLLFTGNNSFSRNFAQVGGVLYVNSTSFDSVFSANGTLSFRDNAACLGGAFYVDSLFAEMVVSANVTFLRNSLASTRASSCTFLNGGAIWIQRGGLQFKSPLLFADNSAGQSGGAIFMFTGSSVSFSASEISFVGNNAGRIGGAIAVAGGACDFSDSSHALFESNLSSGGGAIAVEAGAVYIRGASNFVGNGAVNNTQQGGGSLLVLSGFSGPLSVISIFGPSSFSRSVSQFWGGGAAFLSGPYSTLRILGSSLFSGNSAPAGGAIFLQTGAFAMITSCMLQYNRANDASSGGGGAISVNSAALHLLNSTLHGNAVIAAGGSGGAVSASSAFGAPTLPVEISNCTFSRNFVSAGGQGGAVFISQFLTIRNSLFLENSALTGDNIYVQRGNPVFDSISFQNYSVSAFGHIVLNSGISTFVNCSFSSATGNSAVGVLVSSGDHTFAGCKFTNLSAPDATADARGLALFIQSGTVEVVDSQFSFLNVKHSAVGGSAVYVFDGRVSFTRCRFFSNIAISGNGTIYVLSGSVSISESFFANNAALNGAGVYLGRLSAGLNASDVRFSRQVASNIGGAVATVGSQLLVKRMLATDNSAFGGAVFGVDYSSFDFADLDCSIVFCSDCIFTKNRATFGGAILYISLFPVNAGCHPPFSGLLEYNNSASFGTIVASSPAFIESWGSSLSVYPGDPSFFLSTVVKDSFNHTAIIDQDGILYGCLDCPINSPTGAFFNTSGVAEGHVPITAFPSTEFVTLFGVLGRTRPSLSPDGYGPNVTVRIVGCPAGTGYVYDQFVCRNCIAGQEYNVASGTFGGCYTCPSISQAECFPDSVVWKQGWWAHVYEDAGHVNMFACSPTACLDGGVCAAHRDPLSVLCSACDHGCSPWNGDCMICESANGVVIFGALVLSWLFVLLQHVWSQGASATTRIFGNYMQTLALLFFPNVLFQGDGLISIQGFSPSASQCPYPRSGIGVMVTDALLPLLLFSLLALSFGIITVCKATRLPLFLFPLHVRSNTFLRRLCNIDAFVKTAQVLATLSFQTFARVSFSFLDCYHVDSHFVVATDPSIDCTSAEYRAVLPLFVILLIIVCVWPLAVAWYIWKRQMPIGGPKHVSTSNSTSEASIVHDTVSPSHGDASPPFVSPFVAIYKPRFCLFEVVVLVRKIILISVFVIFSSSPVHDFRRRSVNLVNLGILLISTLARPYHSSLDNFLEIFSLAALVAIGNVLGGIDDETLNISTARILSLLIMSVILFFVLSKPLYKILIHNRLHRRAAPVARRNLHEPLLLHSISTETAVSSSSSSAYGLEHPEND
eukprot:ANDGO_02772.mRNA.1 hypothetical protein DDB_G0285055